MVWPFRRATPPAARTRALDAATSRDRWNGPISTGAGNGDVLAGLATVRARSRHSVLNNSWMSNGIAGDVAATIGSGISATCLVEDRTARTAITRAQARWALSADIEGRLDWPAIQALAYREMLVAGECFILLIATPEGLRLQVLPGESVDSSVNRELAGGGRIVAGIEFNAIGQRVGYWILPAASFAGGNAAVRHDGQDVIHLFRPLFPGQVRGLPKAAAVLTSLNELDQLEYALLIATKTSAMLCGFITDQNSTGPIPFEGDQQGSVLTGGLEPGVLKVLNAGQDIKFSAPQQQNTAIDLARMTLDSIAAGLGVPSWIVSGNLNQANYSSLRAALVEFRSRVEQTQFHVLIPQLLRPIWRRWMTIEVLSGRISAPGFEQDVESWLNVEFYPPSQQWVDPEKDAKAEGEMIANGLKSRRQSVAQLGFDIETLDSEIAADRERERRLGLSFGQAPATGVPPNA